MALAVVAENDQAASIGTEHDLTGNLTGGKTYELSVDTNALAADDVVELRIYQKVRSGSTERLRDVISIGGPVAPTNKVWVSYPVAAKHHCRFSLKQTAGTGRTFPWTVLSLD